MYFVVCFNDFCTLYSSYYIASYRIGYGKIWLWPNLTNYFGCFVKGLKKINKMLGVDSLCYGQFLKWEAVTDRGNFLSVVF